MEWMCRKKFEWMYVSMYVQMFRHSIPAATFRRDATVPENRFVLLSARDARERNIRAPAR